MVRSKDIFRRDLREFRSVLESQGYFYDVNQIFNFFSYKRKYTPVDIKNSWKSALSRKARGELDFYIHIPFCASKCAYCLYPSRAQPDDIVLDDYLDYLEKSMDYYASVFKKRSFRNIYIGGGTPNIFGKKRLGQLFSRLINNYSFFQNTQRTCECNPHWVSKDFFSVLVDYGFNRISLGVQSLGPKALAAAKRDYQKPARIKKVIKAAKESGIRDINVDLIAGLPGDNTDSFLESFKSIALAKPSNIVVYGLMPPNDAYLEDNFSLTRKSYFQSRYPKIISDLWPRLAVLALKYGYIFDSIDQSRFRVGFRLKNQPTDSVATYSGEHRGGGCTFGLGFFSRSHIYGLLEYRQIESSKKFNSNAYIYIGRRMSLKEEMLKWIINQIDQHSAIYKDSFKETFSLDIEDVFYYPIYALNQLGKVEITEKKIGLKLFRPEDKYLLTLFFLKYRHRCGKKENRKR